MEQLLLADAAGTHSGIYARHENHCQIGALKYVIITCTNVRSGNRSRICKPK